MTRQQDKALKRRRPRRAPGAAGHRHLPGRHQQVVRREPARRAAVRSRATSTRSTRSRRSTSARAAAQEVENALFLDAARDKLGRQARQPGLRGPAPAQRSRRRRRPRARRAPHQTKRLGARPKGLVRLEQGRFKSAGVKLPGAGRGGRGGARATRRPTSCWSTATRSATGTPIMVGGPQIGYNYPGLTMEIGLYGPTHPRSRRDLRAVPRLHADRPRRRSSRGRSRRPAPTSSTPTPSGCAAARGRSTATRAGAAGWRRSTPARSRRAADKVKVRFRRTVHGPVIGYARVAGTRARRSRCRAERSSAGRETTDQIFFQRPDVRPRAQRRRLHPRRRRPRRRRSTRSTPTRRTSRSSPPAACRCGRRASTATCRSTAAAGSSGRATWRAAQAPAGHQPVSGLLVNWNNKPAKDFPAGDEPLGRGRHAARRLAARGAGPQRRSTRRRPCSARRTRARPPTRAG